MAQTPTLTPQAQQGLDYLRTRYPDTADAVMKQFAPATPIDVSTITSPSTISVPPMPQTPVPDYTRLAVSTPSVPTTITNTARQDELDAERAGIVSDITATTDKLATKSARKGELEIAQNVPGLSAQLNEVMGQIRNLDAEALAANENSENRHAPMFAIRGEQAAIERQRAVRKYGLAATAEAIQGNISLANDNVSRALDAEFGGKEQEIENKKFLLQINMDNFEREEKRAAEARVIELDREKETLAQQREDRQSVMNIMLSAAQSGADNLTLSRIQGAKTPEEAIALAGTALGAEFAQKLQQQKFENNLALRNVALDEAKFAYQKIADQAAANGLVVTAKTAQDLTSVLGNAKIGQGTKTSVGTILGVISAVEDLSKSRSDGKFAGFYPGAAAVEFFLPAALKRTATVENEGYLNAINLKVQQWASGATLTESQTKLVEGMVPKKNDSDSIIKAKLNNLTNFMQQQIKGSLLAEGIAYEPAKVDLWASQKSLADIFGGTSTTTPSK